MTRHFLLFACALFVMQYSRAVDPRTTIDLNGIWEFDQTLNAFPPKKFTRNIRVPGLITLAEPKIEDYDKFFKRPDKVQAKEQHSLYEIDYIPKYSWYRKRVFVPADLQGKEAVITLKKSQYVTRIYINGHDLGTSMACYTPIEFRATQAIIPGTENEILICVGDRTWLPSEAAGGTDKEKEHYLPGIWDDVFLSFTGDLRINRLLLLPSVTDKKVTAKVQVRSFKPAQIFYGDRMEDSAILVINIKDRKSGIQIASASEKFMAKRDNITLLAIDIDLQNFKHWSPEHPELYMADVSIMNDRNVSDNISKMFGMRDFTRKGKLFYLNGNPYFLRGTNITLQRFFEDPDSRGLVWDKAWVKKLLIDYPKQLNWNTMRICVGIVPDFWYELADEYGLMFQNEWLYWQNHGWDDQIRKEYTDWVWSDGTHPSIAIWDAINENTDEFIGNKLIPELKILDPTRIWDAGYMTSDQMNQDEMDEPHPYQSPWNTDIKEFEKNPYPLGDLSFRPDIIRQMEQSSSAQLVNEYGWIWLWRNGTPSKLTVDVYNYYLGPGSTAEQNREMQAYWLQLETEWLRSNTSVAGVLAFCYLANNYGYTGDWFINDIGDLQPGLTLSWFRHCFAPAAVFLNLTDERYTKHIPPHNPGSSLLFNMAGINNNSSAVKGKLLVKLLDKDGRVAVSKVSEIVLKALGRTDLVESIELPDTPGGYLLIAEFIQDGSREPIISRRYLKIADAGQYIFYNLKVESLKQ